MNFSKKVKSHPGKIEYTEIPEGEYGFLLADQMQDNEKFVFFSKGKETLKKLDADEVVPIVRIEILYIDEKKAPCPKEKAHQRVITEFGPEQRFLRKRIESYKKK